MRKNAPAGDSGLVYSTETGRMCPACRQPLANCLCKARAKAVPAGDGTARVTREKQGRGGKTVTVVDGFIGIGLPEKEQLCKKMRGACGCGGTVKEGRIEIQGDQRETIARILTEAGFRAVMAGG